MYRKLFLALMIILILAFGIVTLCVLEYTDDIVYNNLVSAYQLSLSSDVYMFEQRLNHAKNYLLSLAINEDVQNTMQEIATSDTDAFEDSEYIARMQYAGNQLLAGTSGYKISYYPISSDGDIYERKDGSYTINQDLVHAPWYEKTISKNGTVGWSYIILDGIKYIRMTSLIHSTSAWEHSIGIVAVDMNFSLLSTQLCVGNLGKTGIAYLFDENGNQMYPYAQLNISSETLRQLITEKVVIDNENMLIYSVVKPFGWYVIGSIPMKEIVSKSTEVRNRILITASVTVLVTMVVVFLFSYFFYRPIKYLAKTMRRQANTPQLIMIPKSINGEMRLLYESYNNMTEKINKLIDDIYASTNREKEIELKLLQSQINPHFLYNTLDSVGWLSLRYNALDIYEITLSLGNMLRYGLNGGHELISIEKELAQVDSYINIQRFRYDNNFTADYDVDDEVASCQIIHFILQPLVENAIVHGFEEFKGRKHIHISIKRNDNTLRIGVYNTGRAADLDKIEKILSGDIPDTQSYGIRNVNERLTKRYGVQSRLTFLKSAPRDYSTAAEIQIPLTEEVSNNV